MKRKVFIILFLQIFSFNFLINGSSKDFPYDGLSIYVPQEHYNKIVDMYKGIYNPIYVSSKISLIQKNDILESLKDNFKKMVDSFKANQGNLPKCLQDAFNAFLNEINTLDQNGKPRAAIEWKIYDDRPGSGAYDRSKYNKDYDDFYFQDVNSSKVTFNGWEFNIDSNCGGGFYSEIQTGGTQWGSNTSLVYIYGAFKDKCRAHGKYTEIVNGKEVEKTYDTMISTPALMFHEWEQFPG